MEALNKALLGVTQRLYQFVAPPNTAPPYVVWQKDGETVLAAGDRHAERADVVILDLFTRQADDPLIGRIEETFEARGVSWYLESTQYEDETSLYHYEWYAEVP